MKEKIGAYLEKAKAVLKKVSKKVYIALVVLLVAAVAVVVWLNTRPYEVLFTELNSTDLSSIVSYLKNAGVTDYKIENNDTILVSPGQEDSLRATLLMEGYPTSGFSYVTTETSALSTQAERNQAVLNSLQESMSSTVRAFANVKDAIVYINTGEDRSYVLDSGNVVEASATVVVEMKSGTQLTREQAAAIRRLVAYAVAGLDISNVTIEDTIGNTYSDLDAYTDSEASALKLQLEEEYENSIRTKVVQALTPFFGEKDVQVSVSCTVDINQTVTENTDYFLPEYAQDGSTYGRGIVGSRIYSYVIERDAEEPVGGTVGTETNSDVSEYVEDMPELNGDENYVDISGQTDYVTSNSKKQIIQTAGYLTDCSIAVSINSEKAGLVDLSQFVQHVARAAGIEGTYDEDGVEHLDQYISIVSAPFAKEEEVPVEDPATVLDVLETFGIELWMLIAAGGGLLLFLIILLVLLRRRKKKKKKKQEERQARDMEEFLAAAAAAARPEAPQTGADVMSMQSEKSIELRKDIRKFAEDNPEIAAQMLKSWLRGDEDNG